jgi:hemerythrin superfamily protein
MNQPIKRHNALQPLSREHHNALLFCWKIREGIKRQVEPERIKQYVNWFWKTHLANHFQTEERYIFPILPAINDNIKQAISEHRTLQQLFETIKKLYNHSASLKKHYQSTFALKKEFYSTRFN